MIQDKIREASRDGKLPKTRHLKGSPSYEVVSASPFPILIRQKNEVKIIYNSTTHFLT